MYRLARETIRRIVYFAFAAIGVLLFALYLYTYISQLDSSETLRQRQIHRQLLDRPSQSDDGSYTDQLEWRQTIWKRPKADWGREEKTSLPSSTKSSSRLLTPGIFNLAHPLPTFVFVTAGNERYFNSIENLIGSIHSYAANHLILVYDLGFSLDHRRILGSYWNVQLVPLEDWYNERYRPHEHILNARSFAFKPIVMFDAMKRMEVGSMIFLDAGLELASFPITMAEMLHEQGYYYVAQMGAHTNDMCCGTIDELTHVDTFKYLHLNPSDFVGKLMSAGGIQGYHWKPSYAHSPPANMPNYRNAVELVLEPVVECAIVEKCITPIGSSLKNHRQDQSIFSIYVELAKLHIDRAYANWATRTNILQVSGAEFHSVAIFKRRDLEWKPYRARLIRHTRLALVIPFIVSQVEEMRQQLKQYETYQPCQAPMAHNVSILFYYNGRRNSTLAETLSGMINGLSPTVRACFDSAQVFYASLTPSEDTYPFGPNHQFIRLWDHEVLGLQQYGYSHMLIMEPDTVPIRRGWLDQLANTMRDETYHRRVEWSNQGAYQQFASRPLSLSAPSLSPPPSLSSTFSPLAYDASSWWMQGSLLRGNSDSPIDEMSHMNGNAIYSLSSEFHQFLHRVWDKLPLTDTAHSPSFDLATFYWLWGTPAEWRSCRPDSDRIERQRVLANVWHRFVYTPLIINCGEIGCDHPRLVELDHPDTVIVHKLHGKTKVEQSGYLVWIYLCIGLLGISVLFLIFYCLRRRSMNSSPTRSHEPIPMHERLT